MSMRAPARLPRELAPRTRPRHLRVVEEAPRPRRRLRLTRLSGSLIAGVVVACMFAVAICQALLVQRQLHLDELDARVTEAHEQYQQNRLKLAQLESPERIVRAARERLGMVDPEEVVYLAPGITEAPGSDVELDVPEGAETAAPDGDAAAEGWEDVKPYLEGAP